MTLSRGRVIEVLEALSDGKLNGQRSSYVAGLIVDSLSDEDLAAPDLDERCWNLVSTILLDAHVVDSEQTDPEAVAKEGIDFCATLLARLRGQSETVESDYTEDGRKRFDRPVVLSKLIATKVLRQQQTTQDDEEGQADSPERTDSAEEPRVVGFDDPFLGLERSAGNYNAVMPAEESMRIAKTASKRREKQLRLMQQWEKSRVPLPPPKRRHGDKQFRKLTDIHVHSFSVSVAGRELLKDAQLRVVIGRIYGLIGRNGIGKTTFISAFVRHDIPGIDPDLNIGSVEQEFDYAMEYTPLECVLKCDEEREMLLQEESRLTEQEDTDEKGRRLAWIYERLEEIEADKAVTDACRVLGGLGLTERVYKNEKLKNLSGGWRMRVMLAKLLFANPDIMLLDEPTNHLDIHAVAWLTQYLKTSGKTCIIVSHARSFLNDVCTDIMEFKDRILRYYTGNYDAFERSKAERELHMQKQIENVEAQRAHIQKFIDKRRCNANTASMAQSRLKALARLPLLEKMTEDPTLQFKFPNPTDLPSPMLVMQDVSFSWKKGGELLLRNVDFSADLSSRIAICGVNGSGKSTFLKLLLGEVEPSSGFVFRHGKLKIGYFAQHHLDNLDLTHSAVRELQERYYPMGVKISDEEARGYLGRFGISGLMALEPLYILSGGQKSRVVLAIMSYMEPHMLVLDEPTNHLDLDAVGALIGALTAYGGGVIMVSHDSHLISCVAEEIWYIGGGGAFRKFDGENFDMYRELALRRKI